MQRKGKKIDLDDIEIKRRFGSQLTKYLGGKDKVKVFVKECKSVGLNIGNPDIIRNIAKEPEYFTVLISYSELGLLKKLGEAITKIKEIKNGNKN